MQNDLTIQPFATQGEGYHIPVLYSECMELLQVKEGGVYVDCTFGGGGHSRGLLNAAGASGKVIAFDQDADAMRNISAGENLLFIPQNFRYLSRFLRLHNIDKVDGLLADLGVSSFQFNEASRGFSYRYEGDMDMRMDTRQPLTAYDVLMTRTEQDLHKLFEQYGEVTNSKTLAKRIVEQRLQVSLQSIDGFKNAVRDIVKGNPAKYFAQVFQALRIEVNDEMGALKDLLEQLPAVLKPGARAAIITFHSIEDRMVKRFFKKGSYDEVEENPFAQNEKISELKFITKKPIIATDQEIKNNSRSRSAKLRVAEKI